MGFSYGARQFTRKGGWGYYASFHFLPQYKQSSIYKQAVKLETEREKENKKKMKKNKAGGEKGAKERHGQTNIDTPPVERRWREMFAVALTQTKELVEQMNLLHKTIEEYDKEEEKHRRIEDALSSLVTAQDEVDTLSKTLKKAISAAGLESMQENLLDEPLNSEGELIWTPLNRQYLKIYLPFITRPLILSKVPRLIKRIKLQLFLCCCGADNKATVKKSHLLPSGQRHSPRLVRANTYDGVPKRVLSKTASTPPNSPLSSIHTPLPLTTTPAATSPPPPPPISTIPPIPVPVPAPTVPSDTNRSKPTPSAVPPSQKSPPTVNKGIATPLAVVPPTALSTANKTKATPPAVKTKPVNKTPEFSRKKLESHFPEGASKPPTSSTFESKSALAHASSTNPTSPLTIVSRSHTLPAISKILEHSSTSTPPLLGPEDGNDSEHVYENPKEESEDMYMNSSMVVVGMVGSTTQLSAGSSNTQGEQKMKKNESSVSVQADSGLGREEDKTWPQPELKEPESKDPLYQNVKILTLPEGYTKFGTTSPALTGEYTTPNTGTSLKPTLGESNWGTIVHDTQHHGLAHTTTGPTPTGNTKR